MEKFLLLKMLCNSNKIFLGSPVFNPCSPDEFRRRSLSYSSVLGAVTVDRPAPGVLQPVWDLVSCLMEEGP